jgi:SiaC family regulatory phosphoprotein
MTNANDHIDLNDLHIAATDETPEVFLSCKSVPCYLKGRSLPENAFEFYRPIISWAKQYIEVSRHGLDLTMSFDYLNSSSSRFLFEMLHALDQSVGSTSYHIKWKVDPEDELMIEKGEELQRLLKLKIEILS